MSDMNKKVENKALEQIVSLKELKLPQDLKKLSISQCERLCREIRCVLIDSVMKNGGHLASNLGTVELTMALHRAFDSPKDKLVWDVGHQAYTHKILTGRLDRFDMLRQENGISGFPKPCESEHDVCICGHSSVSISVACGIAEAMKLNNDPHYAVAVIGDGAFTGGMAYEGLNNAGKSNARLIVILNHNDMSISKNVGAFAKYLRSMRNAQGYINTKNVVQKTLSKTPVIGEPIRKAMVFSKKALKGVLVHNSTMFEDLGFIYLGPVDGHDLEELDSVLAIAKSYNQPVFVHVNTIKGKGYMPAEKNPGGYHGVSKFDMMSGNPEIASDDCYSATFGRELVRLAKTDEKICAVTAAMKYGTGLQYFYGEFKERFFDVGIAEQHAVTFCAGLASMGKTPVFAVYSSFLQRAYDQLMHDVAIAGVHVVIGVDRAGIVGEDGETHQGIFDIPMLTSIPNTVIYSPSCYRELEICLDKAVYDEKGLVCVRYPRGSDSTSFNKDKLNTDYTIIKKNNSSILIITYGRIYDELCKADAVLSGEGIVCDILKLTKILPVNPEAVKLASGYKTVLFFEESYAVGGIGEHFGLLLNKYGFGGSYTLRAINGFVKQASVARALELNGLDCGGMAEAVRDATLM